jgi:lipopolysaccharide transport system ATP-binding protein
MADPAPGAIQVRDLGRDYKLVKDRSLTLKETLLRRRRTEATTVEALRGVSFDVAPGEAIGIIGKNGSGKSTLLKVLAGIIKPHRGEVRIGGTVASMLELGAGFHPDYTGRENVYLNGSIYGMRRAEIDERFDDIVAFAEIPDFVDAPVRTYSSGMYMRLAFAIASHVNPDVLLLDEVLSVGDEAFQMKCMGRIFEYQQRGGTLVLVSHDPGSIERVCDRAVLLEDGELVAEGPAGEVLSEYHRRLAGAASGAAAADDDRSWGTGEVQIAAGRLIGPNGPSQRFMSGEHLTIEMDVVPSRPVEAPVYTVGIATADGLPCFETSTRLDSQATHRLVSPTRIRFTIPALPLHEGAFIASVSIAAHDESEVFHALDRWLPFSVFQSSPGKGIVRMSGAWEIHAITAENAGATTGDLAKAAPGGPPAPASGTRSL